VEFGFYFVYVIPSLRGISYEVGQHLSKAKNSLALVLVLALVLALD